MGGSSTRAWGLKQRRGFKRTWLLDIQILSTWLNGLPALDGRRSDLLGQISMTVNEQNHAQLQGSNNSDCSQRGPHAAAHVCGCPAPFVSLPDLSSIGSPFFALCTMQHLI